MGSTRFLGSFLVAVTIAILVPRSAPGSTIIGGLIGGDLTDPENDGNDSTLAGTNFNATFAASDKPSFDPAEGAFNVFDNKVGAAGARTNIAVAPHPRTSPRIHLRSTRRSRCGTC